MIIEENKVMKITSFDEIVFTSSGHKFAPGSCYAKILYILILHWGCS
jgi:hypothetical protein